MWLRREGRTHAAQDGVRAGAGDTGQKVMCGCGGRDGHMWPRMGCGRGQRALTHLQPDHNSGPVPLCERQALSPGFLEQLVSASKETFKIQESPLHTYIKQVSLSINSLYTLFKSEIVHISSRSFNLPNLMAVWTYCKEHLSHQMLKESPKFPTESPPSRMKGLLPSLKKSGVCTTKSGQSKEKHIHSSLSQQ